MRYIRKQSAGQLEIRAYDYADEIASNSIVRFIALFVASLDLKALGFTGTKPAKTGRPGYDPRVMIQLYIYGYLNSIRSSRKLERECRRNIELFYLLGRLTPDHNTIADFRKNNAKAIKKLFYIFVQSCREMKLMGSESVCLDGTTIRAANGKKNATNAELSRKKLEYAKAQLEAVERYLKTLDENDLKEKRTTGALVLDLDKEHLPDIEKLKERIAKHEQDLKTLEETGAKALVKNDPEAGLMPAKEGGIKVCYNMQTAVDVKSHMIAGFEATNIPSDRGQISSSMKPIMEDSGISTIHVIADKGYDSTNDVEDCLMNGIAADAGFIYDRDDRVITLEYHATENPEELKTSTQKKDIQACLHAGILPDCYANGNIRIEVQEKSVISCFIRHEDGHVTCPHGKELYRLREAKSGTDYGSREACRTCTNRCTDSKHRKVVRFGPETVYVPVYMYGSSESPLQQIPDIEQNTHYNRFGRVPQQEKRVVIRVRRDIQKQKLRQRVSEHPFGTIKHWDGASFFLCKGKEKVSAEYALSCLSYNFRRAYNICEGFENLEKRWNHFIGTTMPIWAQKTKKQG